MTHDYKAALEWLHISRTGKNQWDKMATFVQNHHRAIREALELASNSQARKRAYKKLLAWEGYKEAVGPRANIADYNQYCATWIEENWDLLSEVLQ